MSAIAQEGMEDVIYLKGGNIYRGIIIEQVPGETMKIQTVGGNVFTVAIADIAKITKENKIGYVAPQHYTPDYGGHGGYGEHTEHWRGFHHMDSSFLHSHREFHPKKRGYFNEAYLIAEAVQGGGRLINGYKFGRLGYLGIGVGIDLVKSSPLSRDHDLKNMNGNPIADTYLPLFLYYGGNILNKNITPFYAIEVGYAWAVNPHGDNMFGGGSNNYNNPRGGMMASINLGVKFGAKRKIHCSLAASLDYKSISYNRNEVMIDANGNSYMSSNRIRTNVFFPGIKLGIGF
jgi:hypothetical protein